MRDSPTDAPAPNDTPTAPRPEALQRTADGEPFSARYRDVYASRAGALGQARAVYLQGCGLLGEQPTWRGRRQFVVLETGFGLGTNFLATWLAWRDDPQRPEVLHYVALELHPLCADDLLRACVDPTLGELARELARRWPPAMRGVHPVWLDGGRVRLLLVLGDAQDMLPRLELGADAVYLDGFAPSRNPRMWSGELLRDVARVCRPGARAASYTVARVVCDGLRVAGFEVRKLPGYGGKAQRLQAQLRTVPAESRARLARESAGSAMVVGAGLAGAACAQALARRGWRVQVLDARGAAGGTSSLPAGLAHLRPADAEDRLSRLTRSALGWLHDALPADAACGLLRGDGVLMSGEQARRSRLDEQAADWPAQWLRGVDARAAAGLAGTQHAPRAWWTGGSAVAAGALCRAWLAQPGVELLAPRAVHALRRDPDGSHATPWQALDAEGRVLAQASVCVLACAADGVRLLQASGLATRHAAPRLRLQSGQGFVVPAAGVPALRGLRMGVMAGGYALPLPRASLRAAGLDDAQEWLFVGATHEHAPHPAMSQQQAWEHIGAALRPWIDPPAAGADAEGGDDTSWPCVPPPQSVAFRGERAAGWDRLPLVGAWPDAAAEASPADSGLYLSLGMGSRGLLLSALAAQCIASQLEGEPAPLERDLLLALDPLRAPGPRAPKASPDPPPKGP